MCLIWTGTGNRLIRWKGFHFLKRLQIAWHIPFLQGFHNRGPSGGMLNKDKKTVYSYIHIIVLFLGTKISILSHTLWFLPVSVGLVYAWIVSLLCWHVLWLLLQFLCLKMLVNSLVHVMRNGTGYSMFICEIHFSRFLPPYAICDALE